MGAPVFDSKALYQLGYGLYVLTTRDSEKDNGCTLSCLDISVIKAAGISTNSKNVHPTEARTGLSFCGSISKDSSLLPLTGKQTWVHICCFYADLPKENSCLMGRQ